MKNQVLPGLEPGLQGSKPWVLTNYTIEPELKKILRGNYTTRTRQAKMLRARIELATFCV